MQPERRAQDGGRSAGLTTWASAVPSWLARGPGPGQRAPSAWALLLGIGEQQMESSRSRRLSLEDLRFQSERGDRRLGGPGWRERAPWHPSGRAWMTRRPGRGLRAQNEWGFEIKKRPLDGPPPPSPPLAPPLVPWGAPRDKSTPASWRTTDGTPGLGGESAPIRWWVRTRLSNGRACGNPGRSIELEPVDGHRGGENGGGTMGGARFVCLRVCVAVAADGERDGFHCRWRWRRKPRAPSTLTPVSKETHTQPTLNPPVTTSTSNPPSPPPTPASRDVSPRLREKSSLALSALGRGERGSEVLAPSPAGACYVMARRNPDGAATTASGV